MTETFFVLALTAVIAGSTIAALAYKAQDESEMGKLF